MNIQDIAKNTFTISALLLTATIVLLNYSWKRLKLIIKTMPDGKQRIVVNFNKISDQNERTKYSFILLQLGSCILFTLAFLGALFSMLFMSGVMTGDTSGISFADNFNLAVVSVRASVFCLFMGVIASGTVYLEEFAALYWGTPNLVTTPFEKLPSPKKVDKVWAYILIGLLCSSPLIMVLIDILIPYNQWIKMAIALFVLMFIYTCVRICYRLYVKNKTKITPVNEKTKDI